MKYFLLSLLLGINFANPLLSLPVLADSCKVPAKDPELPSKTFRTIEVEGFKISLPKNYVAMRYTDGRVEILSPEDFRILRCIRVYGIYPNRGRGYESLIFNFASQYPLSTCDDDLDESIEITTNGVKYDVCLDSGTVSFEKDNVTGTLKIEFDGGFSTLEEMKKAAREIMERVTR